MTVPATVFESPTFWQLSVAAFVAAKPANSAPAIDMTSLMRVPPCMKMLGILFPGRSSATGALRRLEVLDAVQDEASGPRATDVGQNHLHHRVFPREVVLRRELDRYVWNHGGAQVPGMAVLPFDRRDQGTDAAVGQHGVRLVAVLIADPAAWLPHEDRAREPLQIADEVAGRRVDP